MLPVLFFQFASQHANWLSERQKLVSENIANASTPNYRAKDVDSFATIFNQSVGMARTHAAHLEGSHSSGLRWNSHVIQAPLDQTIGVQVSGNNVGIANELYKSGHIKSEYDLNAKLVKKLNSMMIHVARG
ncbi:flagellar basal body rod protein FlgB [Candidatus Liberibacter africanus]|uniref:Flagellar basal body rod protein FlgB n=1 Tax=Candidatus Liberibacter africanus PTSAPSY TaxID=1277257 RepID=A0A0G3I6A4_LIBAF|nr:flagellar basal body rod protein FlgB [Candidatus Liberibacter africanus]AKK19983.1 flagellar basal body rod protein FlgB [Candidatus Liberibacter africanus PTSAPSY]QTP63815.1 flagellar basal body rod protein FlgB [Candidatus Liberibacter africanus]